MRTFTHEYRLAFLQATNDIPEDLKRIIWSLSLDTVYKVPDAPKKSTVRCTYGRRNSH